MGQQIAKGSNKESEREKKMHEKAKTEENKNNKKTETFIHLYLPSEQFSPDQPAKQEHFSDSMS